MSACNHISCALHVWNYVLKAKNNSKLLVALYLFSPENCFHFKVVLTWISINFNRFLYYCSVAFFLLLNILGSSMNGASIEFTSGIFKKKKKRNPVISGVENCIKLYFSISFFRYIARSQEYTIRKKIVSSIKYIEANWVVT